MRCLAELLTCLKAKAIESPGLIQSAQHLMTVMSTAASIIVPQGLKHESRPRLLILAENVVLLVSDTSRAVLSICSVLLRFMQGHDMLLGLLKGIWGACSPPGCAPIQTPPLFIPLPFRGRQGDGHSLAAYSA